MVRYFLGLSLLLLLLCSATETDTGEMITGQVQNSNKDTLSNVTVIMRYQATSNSTLKKSAIPSLGLMENDTTFTDQHGMFVFKNPGAQELFFEFNADTLAAFVEVRFDSQVDKSRELAPVICTPPGRIEGKIEESSIDDIDFLYIRKLDLVVQIDSLGYFVTRTIPSGSYTFESIKNNSIVPSKMDTINIKVNSKDTSSVSFCSDSVLFVITPQTSALWSFNKQIGNTIPDLSGNLNQLILYKDIIMTPGKYSISIDLHDSAYCFADSSPSLKSETIDIEAVVNISELPPAIPSQVSLAMIVSNTDFSDSQFFGYELRIADSTGHLEFLIGTINGWQIVKTANSLQIRKWYNIRGIFDGSILVVYVDGEKWGELKYQGLIQYTNKCYLTIGRRYLDQPFYFSGKIDEIRISRPVN